MKIWNGANARHRDFRGGIILRAGSRVEGEWRHPWAVDVYFERGGWRAYVEPGFVNGRDAFAAFSADMLRATTTTTGVTYADFGINPLTGRPFFSDPVFKQNSAAVQAVQEDAGTESSGIMVPLTHDPRPFLLLDGWRDPVQVSGLVEGPGTSGLRLLPGEGYPAFFATIGVQPAARGGDFADVESGPQRDASRTRQIRAADVVLTIPRIGTKLDYEAGNALIQQQNQFIQTTFTTGYYNSVQGRAVLKVLSKYVPPSAEDEKPIADIYGNLLNYGSREYDDVFMATIYMVSPPDAAGEPDGTWEPYVQHRVFWNLNSATNIVPSTQTDERIRLAIPLAAGLAQPIFDVLLAFVNDNTEAAQNFLNGAQAKGWQWSV